MSEMFKPSFKKVKFDKVFNGRKSIEDMYKSETWKKYSRKFLDINKVCYSCGGKSEAVDHVVPHQGDEKLFWKTDNMIPLCHRCHNTVTSKFDRYFNKSKRNTDEKLKWIARNRALNGVSVKSLVVPVSPVLR